MSHFKRFLMLTALLYLNNPISDGARAQRKVFLQKHSITEYLYQYDLPALSDLTYCIWMNWAHSVSKVYPVSISTTARVNNAFLFGWSLKSSPPTIEFCGTVQYPCRKVNMTTQLKNTMMYGWHKHCFVQKYESHAAWYMDSNKRGVLDLYESGPYLGNISAGGALTLLQDQDSFKGSLNLEEVGEGKFSMFNLWDYAMTLNELNDLGCYDMGNVANMETLNMMGTMKMISEEFECLDVAGEKLLNKTNAMVFCRRAGQQLKSGSYQNVTVQSLKDCAKKCTYDVQCHSANFVSAENICELSSMDENEGPADLEEAAGVIHLSPVACY